MKPVIWYQLGIDEANRARLEPHAEIVEGGDVAQLKDVFAIVIGSLIDANGALMDTIGPSLRAIVRPGIGVDNVNIADATERGILVINTPDGPTESTAEHAVALLLAVAKRVVTGARFLQTNGTDRSIMFGTEVRDRVLAVIGCGRIGRRVAEICSLGLKMRVIVYDPYIESLQMPGVEFTNDLDSLIQQADFVTLHLPYMPETRHLMNETRLRSMKKGAYLINAARGPIVDEQALIRVLQEGHLGGAGLDVFDPEPPKPDNPLLTMPNVVCTPHTASFTDMGAARMRGGVVDQLIQLIHNERPPHIVNPQAWPGRMQPAQSTERQR